MGRPTIRKSGKPLSSTERVRRHRLKARRTRRQIRGLDAYPTHPELLERLLKAEPGLVPHAVWEPCCGAGNLSKVLLARGHHVISDDIVPYPDCPDQTVADFLESTSTPPNVEVIVTNPPYRDDMGATFVRHALALRPAIPILMLLPVLFLTAESRKDIHERIVRAWIFRRRPPRMHRLDHDGPKASAQLDVAWVLMHANHNGRAEVAWL